MSTTDRELEAAEERPPPPARLRLSSDEESSGGGEESDEEGEDGWDEEPLGVGGEDSPRESTDLRLAASVHFPLLNSTNIYSTRSFEWCGHNFVLVATQSGLTVLGAEDARRSADELIVKPPAVLRLDDLPADAEILAVDVFSVNGRDPPTMVVAFCVQSVHSALASSAKGVQSYLHVYHSAHGWCSSVDVPHDHDPIPPSGPSSVAASPSSHQQRAALNAVPAAFESRQFFPSRCSQSFALSYTPFGVYHSRFLGAHGRCDIVVAGYNHRLNVYRWQLLSGADLGLGADGGGGGGVGAIAPPNFSVRGQFAELDRDSANYPKVLGALGLEENDDVTAFAVARQAAPGGAGTGQVVVVAAGTRSGRVHVVAQQQQQQDDEFWRGTLTVQGPVSSLSLGTHQVPRPPAAPQEQDLLTDLVRRASLQRVGATLAGGGGPATVRRVSATPPVGSPRQGGAAQQQQQQQQPNPRRGGRGGAGKPRGRRRPRAGGHRRGPSRSATASPSGAALSSSSSSLLLSSSSSSLDLELVVGDGMGAAFVVTGVVPAVFSALSGTVAAFRSVRGLPFSDQHDSVLCVAAVDLDGDGERELLVGTYGQMLLVYKRGSLGRLAGRDVRPRDSGAAEAGDGEYRLVATHAFQDPITGITACDLNADGIHEVVVTTMYGVTVLQPDASLIEARLLERLEVADEILRLEAALTASSDVSSKK